MTQDAFDKLRDREASAKADGLLRDHYGFTVKREFVALYKKFSPLWQEEEAERSLLWAQFIEDQQEGRPAEPDGQTLQRILSAYETSASAAEPTPEVAACLQQLRALVQAGVPMAARGLYWRLFLRTDAKRAAHPPGLYAQLVEHALEGSPFAQRSSAAGAGEEVEQTGEAAERQQGSGSGGAEALVGKQCVLEGVGSLGLPVVEICADSSSQGAAAVAVVAAGHQQAQQAQQAQHATFTVTSEAIQPRGETAPAGGDAAANAASVPSAEPPACAEPPGDWPSTPTASPAASCSSDGGSSCGGVLSDTGGSTYWRAKDWLGQIEKDLHRTFPGHPTMDAAGRDVLRRILAAYARHNPSVGYCQGMNFITACFMLFMGEEEAFWCLAAVVEELLPGYFDTRMVAPQVDQRAFAHLLQASFPTVMSHLEALEVDLTSVTMHWFLCMFVNSLPLETCLRVWDMLFFEGSPVVLFRVALALVDVYQKALLECRECSDAYMLLQSCGPMTYDSSRLLDTACIGYGQIRDSALRVLRAKYRPPVLEQMRASFASDEEFREYAYYGTAAAEPAHSRSQSFADAFARITAAAASVAANSGGGGGGGASPGPGQAADQGHLTPPGGAAGRANSPGPSGGDKEEGSPSPAASAASGGSSGGGMGRLLPAARQAVSALTARLVPSSLPSLLPSGALGARGEELPPQGAPAAVAEGTSVGGLAARLAKLRSFGGGEGRRASRSGDSQGQVKAPELPTVAEAGGEGGELPHINTRQRGSLDSSNSQQQQLLQEPGTAGSAAAGDAAPRGRLRAALTPFSDPAAALAGGGSSTTEAEEVPPSQHQQQPGSAGSAALGGPSPAASEASTLDALDFRSPIRPQRQPRHHPQQGQTGASPGQRPPTSAHRRVRSELPQSAAAAAERSPVVHRRRRSFLPDLHRLAAFVPDLRQPAVAAAYQIAANPSPRHHHSPSPAQLHQRLGAQRSSPALLYSRTPLSSVFEASAHGAGPGADGQAPAAGGRDGGDGERACSPVRILQFDGGEAEEVGQEEELLPGTAPAGPLGPSPFAGAGSAVLPARRYTDGDACLGASQPWDLCHDSPSGGVARKPSLQPADDAEEAAAGAILAAGRGGEAALTSLTPTGAGPQQAAVAAAAGAAGARGASPARAGGTTPATVAQLLAVIERLQEEVATAESRRHAAELAAAQAAETSAQLRRQLDKLRRQVAEKERVLSDLNSQTAALSSELGDMEGELCAGRMAADQLQQQVERRQQEVAERDELIRLMMDRASRH